MIDGAHTVTTAKLQDEAVEMIISHQVVETMESYGYNPRDTTGADMSSWTNIFLANKYGLMANPNSALFNLFLGFDSHWHEGRLNHDDQILYTGSDSPTTKGLATDGTDVNYYFQGVIFRIFGYSTFTGLEWVQTWKTVSMHGAVSDALQFFFMKGWRELPSFWSRALDQQQRRAQAACRVEVRRQYKHAKRH